MQRAAISWQIRVSIWCFAIGTLLILWTLARISVQQSGTASAPAPQQIAIVPTVAPTDTPEPTVEPPTAIPEPTATPELPTPTPEPTATELPTATPEPTTTELPTATPEPTPTELPTPTPEPTLTPTLLPTTIPTATRVPGTGNRGGTDANPIFFGEGRDRTVDPPWWPCREGEVKGNRNSSIYHTPRGAFYDKTFEDVECFGSDAAADAAGYRASER